MSKTALITGASSGIGKELATIHAQKGGNLVLVARRESKLQALKKALEQAYGIQVEIIVKDLTQPQAAQHIYDSIKALGIEIDYLMNNAGFGGHGKFHERAWEQDLAMIQLNIIALTHLTRLFLPEFVKRNSGHILNTSSTASFMPGPLQAVYFATKAYVTFFSNALSEELHDTNITVTNLMPGATESEFASTSGMDKTGLFDKTASAYSVALDGYNGMLNGKIDVVSGLTTSQKIMMKMIPFTPKKMLLKQIREMQEVHKVSGIRYQVSGIRYQESGIRNH
jgi:short-subunit dehydrogenase